MKIYTAGSGNPDCNRYKGFKIVPTHLIEAEAILRISAQTPLQAPDVN